jgi:hypothetical protein
VLTEPPRDGAAVAEVADAESAAAAPAPCDRADTRWLLTRAAALYVALAIALTGVTAFAIHHSSTDPLIPFGGNQVVGGWCRFDCGWYVSIADNGYFFADPPRQSSVAYFPGYPLVARPLAALLDNTPLALIIVTWLAGLATLLLFARWCASRMRRRTALLAVACFALYPYAFYLYGSGYGDALFLAFAIGAFLLLEDDHPVLAGLAGAAAAATRPIGIAVAAGLVLRAIELRGGLPRRNGDGWLAKLGIPARLDVRRVRARDAGVLLAPLGLVAWSGYLWARFDDPFAYSTVQAAWGQGEGPRTWFKIAFTEELLNGTRTGYRNIIQGLLVVVALVAVPFVARRLSAAYAGYVLLAVALPALSTRDFFGMGRYMLGAFPLFALAGLLLAERPRWRAPVLVAATALLVLGTYGFARNWYLS